MSFASTLATGSSSSNVLLGSGRILFAELDTTTGGPTAAGWEDLGNITDFQLEFSTDTTDRQNYRGCDVLTDLELNNGTTISFSLTADELSSEGISRFTSGTSSTKAIPLGTAVTSQDLIVNPTQYKIYELYDSANNERYLQFASTDNITLNGSTTGALTEGTHYTFDRTHGTIRMLTDLSAETIDWSWVATSNVSVPVSDGFTANSVQGLLKFEGINRNGCTPFEIIFYKALLRPDGSLPLLGANKSELVFSGTISSSPIGKTYYNGSSNFWRILGNLSDTNP